MSERLTRKEKICYGIGDIANGLAISSCSFWLLIYLTDVAGLSAALAGLALMIGRAWDAVTDPVMGWITDHTRSRWGKRRPYLLFGAVAYAATYFLIWIVPDFLSIAGTFWYITVALIAFNTCFTVVFVPYTSMTAAMTTDYGERASLTGYRITLSQVGFLAGAALPIAIVSWIQNDSALPTLRLLEGFFSDLCGPACTIVFSDWMGTPRQGYFFSALLFSILMLICLWVAFWGTREHINVSSTPGATVFNYLKSVVTALRYRRSFRIAVTIILLTNCATTFIGVNLPYYLRYAVDLKDHQTVIIPLIFVVAILTVPLWALITRRYGKAETYRVAMLAYCLVLCCLFWAPAGNSSFLYIVAVPAGFFHAAALMIPWSIIPDVVEDDELQSGTRREGLFYGGTSFGYKLATALAIFFSGFILEAIGYVPNAVQSELVQTSIRSMVSFGSMTFLLLGVLLSLRYPLSAQRHSQIVQQLRERGDLTEE